MEARDLAGSVSDARDPDGFARGAGTGGSKGKGNGRNDRTWGDRIMPYSRGSRSDLGSERGGERQAAAFNLRDPCRGAAGHVPAVRPRNRRPAARSAACGLPISALPVINGGRQKAFTKKRVREARAASWRDAPISLHILFRNHKILCISKLKTQVYE